jgi:tetratricopeptide (TPR) repeat protein
VLQNFQFMREPFAAEVARRARLCAEAAIKSAPTSGLAWTALGRVLTTQRWWGTGLDGAEAEYVDKRAYLVSRAVEAANRGVDLSPESATAHLALFNAYFLRCQPERMRIEAERILALNPNDAALLGIMGNNIAYAGLWDYGVQLAQKGLDLAGPNAPRWWWWVMGKDHYRKGEYQQALAYFRRSYVEQSWMDHLHRLHLALCREDRGSQGGNSDPDEAQAEHEHPGGGPALQHVLFRPRFSREDDQRSQAGGLARRG